ncbi:MAG: hypothetical protein AB8I08_40035 [Sandaracinaceae bacterium]
MRLALVAAVLVAGCVSTAAPAERPSPAIEAAIHEGVQHAWNCEGPVQIRAPEPFVRDVCRDGVTPGDDLSVDGPLRPRGEAAPCRHWEEETLEAPVGEWGVQACGERENFVCVSGCYDRPMVCLPASAAGEIEVRCGAR